MSRKIVRLWLWWVGGLTSPWVALKWRITRRWLDRPTRCWARLVSWGLGFDSLRETLGNSDGTAGCKRDARDQGCCYCGRFACRERLVAIGADPSQVTPIEWVKPIPQESEGSDE